MYCKHCGKEIAMDSRFCSNCGKAQDSTTTSTIDLEQINSTVDFNKTTTSSDPISNPLPDKNRYSTTYPNPEIFTNKNKNSTNSRKKHYISGLLTGSIIIILALIILNFTGIYPSKTNTQDQEIVNSSPEVHYVDSDETTDIASEVDDLDNTSELTISTSSGTIEGTGFDSPEDAAYAYLYALKNSDLSTAISTFAIERCVNHADLQTWIETLSAHNTSMWPSLQTMDSYTRSVNLTMRLSQISNNFFYQYFYLQGKEDIFSSTLRVKDGEYSSSDAILDYMMAPDFTQKLATLEIGKQLSLDEISTLVDRDASSIISASISRKKYLNFDDFESLALEVTIDGELYYFCPDLIKYGDKWYMYEAYGTCANFLNAISYSGGFARASDY